MYEYGYTTATLEEAVAWAESEGIPLPASPNLGMINPERRAAGLPLFRLGVAKPILAAIEDTHSVSDDGDIHPIWVIPATAKHEDYPMADTSDVTVLEPSEAPVQTPTPGMSKTSATLRSLLFDELRDLRSGKSTPQQAVAASKLAHAILDSVRVEMEFASKLFPHDVTKAAMGKPLVLTAE